MEKILSLLITGSKLGALFCFTAMGFFMSPVMAESTPSCHQVQQTQETPDKKVLRSNNCLACKISQNVWNNPFVQSSSDLVTKNLFTKTTPYHCPWINTQLTDILTPHRVDTNSPPDLKDCPCRQLKEKNCVQLRL